MTNSNSFRQDSWEKGSQFENYVETILFPKSLYKLLHKTNDYTQNAQRYVDSSQKPDFKFKCLTTGTEFWVEAKYRSKSYNNKYELLSEQQFGLFPKMLEDGEKICIALGYGGSAEEPGHVAIIPMPEVKSRFIKPTTLANYKCQKDSFQSYQLEELFRNTLASDIELNEPTQLTGKEDEYKPIKKKNKNIKAVVVVLALLALASTFYFINTFNEAAVPSSKEIIKKNVIRYYDAVNSNDYNTMLTILNPMIKHWYGQINIPSSQIVKSAKQTLAKKVMTESIVDVESIDVIPQTDGRYLVKFLMVYKKEHSLGEESQKTNLKMLTYWTSDYKLEYISEIRL